MVDVVSGVDDHSLAPTKWRSGKLSKNGNCAHVINTTTRIISFFVSAATCEGLLTDPLSRLALHLHIVLLYGTFRSRLKPNLQSPIRDAVRLSRTQSNVNGTQTGKGF